jgi:subtilisin family serine protease
MKLFDEIASKVVGGDDGESGTPTITQQLGYDGRGVTVAVADSGLQEGNNPSMHPDLFGRVDAFFFYGGLTDAADEHSHGTHVTGIIAGNAATGEVDENGFRYGLGVAPGAHIIAQRIFDGDGAYEAPPSFEVLTHDAGAMTRRAVMI